MHKENACYEDLGYACLVAIELQPARKKWDISATAPKTDYPHYQMDLRQVLNGMYFTPTFTFGKSTSFRIRPLNYQEFTKVSMQTLEIQRLLHIVNTTWETKKLNYLVKTFGNKILPGGL